MQLESSQQRDCYCKAQRQSSNHEIEGQMSEPDPSLSDSWKNSRRAELKALQRSSPLILTVYN